MSNIVYLTPNHDDDIAIQTSTITTFEREREILAKTEFKCIPDESYPGYKLEKLAMEKFVAANPFPVKFDDSWGYPYTKKIYENITNNEKIKEVGMEIANLGGNTMNKLYIVSYWITHLSPLAKYRFTCSYAGTALNYGFDGVGDWQA
jgi:hypothetical protein